jgi:uncharacterized protein
VTTDPAAGLPFSWLAPALESRPLADRHGRGVFARRLVRRGELLVVWGGRVVDLATLLALPDETRRMSLQIEDDHFLISIDQIDPADLLNHSCDPNAGMAGSVAVVALRAIAVNEEVRYDYAMTDASPINQFDCSCGTAMCRGRVGRDDWRNPALWRRYGNAFSPYLLRRIRLLRRARVDKDCSTSLPA